MLIFKSDKKLIHFLSRAVWYIYSPRRLKSSAALLISVLQFFYLLSSNFPLSSLVIQTVYHAVRKLSHFVVFLSISINCLRIKKHSFHKEFKSAETFAEKLHYEFFFLLGSIAILYHLALVFQVQWYLLCI